MRMGRAGMLLLAILAAVVALFLYRANSGQGEAPLEVSQKVRNQSAQETQWLDATAAQPGDILEHIVLVRLQEARATPMAGIRVSVAASESHPYVEGSLAVVPGAVGPEDAVALFSERGLTVSRIAPGEFVAVTWQTEVAQESDFLGDDAPYLASTATIFAPGYAPKTAGAGASLYSTEPREQPGETVSDTVFPTVSSIQPSRGHQGLSTAVAITGSGLSGIKSLEIEGSGTALVWRRVSGELLEASIPASLPPGMHAIALIKEDGSALPDTLAFEVAASNGRPVVVGAAPGSVQSGTRRTVVLQGVRLDEAASFSLRPQGSDRTHALERASSVNSRVLTVEIPETVPPGEYAILVDGQEQEARIIVN